MTWESALNQAGSFGNHSFITSTPGEALILEKMLEQKWEEMKTICIFMDKLQTLTPQQLYPEKKKTHTL